MIIGDVIQIIDDPETIFEIAQPLKWCIQILSNLESLQKVARAIEGGMYWRTR